MQLLQSGLPASACTLLSMHPELLCMPAAQLAEASVEVSAALSVLAAAAALMPECLSTGSCSWVPLVAASYKSAAALFVQALSRLHARESSRGAQALSHRSHHAESTIFLVSPCPFDVAVELVRGTLQ